MEKWLILRPERELEMMSLEHFVASISEEVLKKTATQMGTEITEHPKAKAEIFDQENKVVLDYKPKYEINIHESTQK